jgi:tetratricopeptide (TPR) repeat protein
VAVLSTVFCVSVFAQSAGQSAGQSSAGQAPSAGQGQTSGQPEKKVKDRGEYDLFETVRTEQNAQKRLDALNQWTQKYPDTDYKKERQLFYLSTYQQLNNAPKMIETANQILAMDPKDFTALFWLATLSMPPAGQNADQAEKAANGMLQNIDDTFSAAKKPQGMDDATWTKTRTDMEFTAHKALGWAASTKKNYDVAERELSKALQMNPNDALTSYWLGQAWYQAKKYPLGLYEYARAAAYTGPGALDATGRKQMDEFLTKAYKGYHGDTTGLQELKTQATQAALPPEGFTIKSVTELAEEANKKAEEEAKKDPSRAIWMNVKQQLTADPNYFTSGMKDAALPQMRGKVVSGTSKELVVSMFDDPSPDVTLKLEEGTFPKVEPGTQITFDKAVPKTFSPNPFMVTMNVDKKDITGLPKATAAPARRPAARKGAARRR